MTILETRIAKHEKQADEWFAKALVVSSKGHTDEYIRFCAFHNRIVVNLTMGMSYADAMYHAASIHDIDTSEVLRKRQEKSE